MGPSSKRTAPFRFQYPSEIELNRQAKTAALRAWSELGLQIVPLLAKKTAYFLLSADQLFKTHSLSGRCLYLLEHLSFRDSWLGSRQKNLSPLGHSPPALLHPRNASPPA